MTEKITRYLLDWIEEYLKSRIALGDEITQIIKTGDNTLEAHYGDRVKIFLVNPMQELIPLTDFSKSTTLVLLNNKEMIDLVVNNWTLLKSKITTNILFVNPFSKLEKKWALNPNTHSKVADKSTLKKGLQTLSENVESITKEEFEKNPD